ncbi:fimbrillin family protein [Bacteroides sp. OttesenSCG-928-J23]|nr:fimbrillin family protein [Bacteroides sp. OttesenSCG-928-N06]MDL2247443.1 fimbrillin family protein [Bacteroides sp. OttesenSCG-928-J23]MDL2304744.1 fimbrillin family protein [Bacteroides sp. OttesenSCG-928-D19]
MNKYIILTATILFLLASCQQEEPATGIVPATINVDTRAVISAGGAITLNVSGTNYDYTMADDEKMSGSPIYIAPGTLTLPVYAWGVVEIDGKDTPIIHANPTTAVSWKDDNNEATAPNINLNFAPATARIAVAVKKDNVVTVPTSATLQGISTPATYFWESNTIPPKLKVDITSVSLSDTYVQAIPGTIPAGAMMLELTVEGKPYPIIATQNYTFLAGMEYTINVAINTEGQANIVSTTVKGFDEGKSITAGDKTHLLRIIANETDLIAFREEVNATPNLKLNALQVADITLTKDWVPIGGSYPNEFQGTYNGNGYTISGLKIKDATGNNQGLFGRTWEAVLANITIKEPVITGTSSTTGALVGYAGGGTISHCAVIDGKVEGNECVGGLVGWAHSIHIAGCYTAGTTATGNSYVGGLVGKALSSTIAACYADAATNVTATTGNGGGLVGWNDGSSSTIAFCYATGTVNDGTTNGGLVGSNVGGKIYSSYTNQSPLVGDGSPADASCCENGSLVLATLISYTDPFPIRVWDGGTSKKLITITSTIWSPNCELDMSKLRP